MKLVCDLIVPLILAAVGICAVVRKTDVFPALTQGAAAGLKTLCEMLPSLAVLFPAIYMLRASGALNAIAEALSPVLSLLGIPPELGVLALLRPISGGAATAVGAELIASSGADSLVGRTAAVMLGSSETTFYVIAVYFGAAGVKKTRWAIPAALCADLAVFVFSALCVRLLY